MIKRDMHEWDIEEEIDECEEEEIEEEKAVVEEKNVLFNDRWHIELNQGELQYETPAGYRVRRMDDGREIVQAYAYVETDRLHEWFSDEYELCREADIQPAPSMAGPYSLRAHTQEGAVDRAVKATIARERMGPNARSPLDMKYIAANLQREAWQEHSRWQKLQEERHFRRMATERMVKSLLEIDLEFVSPEQRAALSALFKLKG